MKKIIAGLLLIYLTAFAWADDQSDIVSSMKAVWDKPDAPLTVKPVIVADGFAIAGWLQGDKGGRALLKKNPHGWQTQLCAGEVSATLLQQAGVPAAVAKQLLDQQITAEKGLSSADVSLLSSFVGVVRMDAAHGHQPHGQQADASAVAHHAH